MVKKIDSFISYWNVIKELMPRNDSEILFFRGQSNGRHQYAEPGICHSLNFCENDEYHQILIDYPEEFSKNSHLSNLVKMQHFGCDTRLLDFSLNPLIALYFATEFDHDTDGKVFVAKVSKKDVLYQDSDKAIMLSCLPKFSKSEQDELKRFFRSHPGRITDQDISVDGIINKFLHEIRSELPAFKSEIVGKDLLQYYFLCPPKDNERMKIQEGAFVIFGLGEKELVQVLNRQLDIIEIEAKAKKEIQKDLNLMRINTSTVYPGLERRAMMNRGRIAEWKSFK